MYIFQFSVNTIKTNPFLSLTWTAPLSESEGLLGLSEWRPERGRVTGNVHSRASLAADDGGRRWKVQVGLRETERNVEVKQ